MEKQLVIPPRYINLLLGILIFLGLYLTSLYSYPLFHSLAEIFSIVIACGIFMIAWNSRRFLENNYLLFIGIAYLFVGGLDLIHTLAYKGMGVFHGYETNLPTQLWIASRYMESLSLFLAPFFFGRKLKVNSVFLGYAFVTFFLLLSIFYWDIFPVCFIEGVGLTPFKKINEYIISLILLVSIFLLLKNRREFEREVLQWVVWSILLTIVSELAFTFYIDAYGLSNLIGHIFKLLSFYLIYKAIIQTGLSKPYNLLFRNLKQSEERFRTIFEQSPIGIELYDLDGRLLEINKACVEIFGVSDVAGVKGFKLFEDPNLSGQAKEILKRGEAVRYEAPFDFEKVRELQLYKTTKSGVHHIDALITPLGIEEKVSLTGYLVQVQDITERKQAENALKKVREELEIRVQERTAELAKAYRELEEQSKILESFFTSTITPFVLLDKNFNFVRVNEAYAKACQRDVSEFPGHNHFEFYPSDAKAIFEQVRDTKIPYRAIARPFVFPDYPEWGTTYWNWTLTPILDDAGEVGFLVFSLEDVTERKEIQRRIEASNAILDLFAKKSLRKEYFDGARELIQHWSGCRCVGIRVLNEKYYIPYESYVGFGQEFWEAENLLSVKYDQCACIRVVTGNPDPQDRSLMTPAGSFRCENTFEFVGNLSEEEKARFRGTCIKNGFKSIAIIPIRYRDKVIGAIHLADEKEGKVPMSHVEFIESMAPLIGEAINRLNLEEELKDSEARLRLLSSQLLTVQENERRRIAREIHDGIGQMLTAIKFKVEDITQQKDKGKAKVMEKSLETIIPLIQESIEEVRRIQMDLRPSTLDDLGILATIDWFCREFEKIYSTIRTEKLIHIHESEVPTYLKIVIFRVMQESLNNIAKHSKADLVRLSLKKKEDRIELVVEDNGTGFDMEKSKKGFGLSSMRERIELSGGSFRIESIQGKGTTIIASWSTQIDNEIRR